MAAKQTMTLDDILKSETGGDGITSVMMKEIFEEEQKERRGRIRRVIKEAISDGKTRLEAAVVTLRQIRKQERERAEYVKKLNDAVEFMNKSGNPFPLLRLCNLYAARNHLRQLGLDPSDYPDSHEIWRVS